MKQLEKVQNNTTWAKASNAINNNNDALYVAVTTLEHAAFKNKGYFKSVALLYGAYPTAENGAQAFVYNSSNPTSAPYDIYEWVNGGWQDSGINGGNVNVNLDSKQDTLVGYSESVSGGKATQVAIQGDAIALSGKVSLGNVDDMESAILMSSSQAGAALAKANTVEQSMSALKSPVKPLHLNSQGKLELNIGKGLYVEDGKLCTTGASGGGGGGATLSEGAGISILNNKISVAYNTKTLGIDSCGGLTVNYGEGLTIKNGKLSAQTSVNAGNGLAQKGDELSVNISTGLQYGSDGELAVKTGKGLSADNTGTINANIDNSTIATNSDGAMYVQKGMLAGQGLKVSLDRLAVNYGNGLTISNRALVVKHGAGLAFDSCGKLYSTVQGGKTYVAGDAIGFDGNNINVRYDGVTISTKDSSDNSLHVMLGSGLKQGSNGIDVAVGEGLAIGSDNKLYSTVSSGKTYTAGDGIDINGNKIAVLYGSGLTTNSCGELKVDVGSLVSGGRGLQYNNDGTMGVSVGAGLKVDTCAVVVNYGSGLAVNSCGKLYSTVSSGPTYTSGDGISISGNKIAVQYCDGLRITNGHLAIATGDGLHIKDNKLAINPSFGLGFTTDGMLKLKLHGKSGLQVTSDGLGVNAGVALSTSDGKLNVQYGTGLAVEGNYIRVEEAVYASIEEANAGVDRAHEVVTKLQTALGGKQNTLTLATGLEWGKTDMIQVKMNAPLNYDNCGRLMLNYDSTLTVSDYKLRVNPYGIIDNEGGLTYNNKGLGVNVGRGLKIDSCQVVVDYGTGLKVVNNKLDVDTSKIAGVGIDLDSDYKKLTIGTKAAKELAGTGLVADGSKMKVKYGSGLTTNTCGGLIVDAENLTVGNADKLGGVSSGNYPRQTLLYERGDYQFFVVLLCKYGAGLTLTRHRLSGRIYSDGAGFGRYVAADVDIFVCDWNGGMEKYLRFDSYGANQMDLITCNYGGVKYLAIRIEGDQAKTVYFEGTSTNMLLTPIKYYTSNTNTVNNAEIHGTIAAISARQPSSNGSKYALVSDTVARAIADSQGNKITTTYAKQFTPTNGLAINNDRYLYLPNLTSTLAGNAVDGSKNGAQRVLNLSCGAIQIKLSTGLAIDDGGYLYIQDKYVTK